MKRLFLLLLCAALFTFPLKWTSAEEIKQKTDPDQLRTEMFQRMEALTGIPWNYFAAINQYEKTIKKTSEKKKDQLISIEIPAQKWGGFLNPNLDEKQLTAIEFFNGLGRDGSGDSLASRENDEDILYSIATYLANYGFTEDDILIGLWEYYNRDKTVQIISEFAKIYETFQTTKLEGSSFPLSIRSNYSYRNTWGVARGYGGRRIHEGTDLFANHGTPVKSVGYGYVEVKGWNRFGGWRIGIRDLNNVYHYYAHLGGFKKDLKIGDIVKPGDVIGWVGSSGYGRPGTSGKFPPHLHYGMYKYNGYTEWAFDPYPYLKRWERKARGKK
jgi:murein DD-endopeptidase MepM/ murein hydrolase activator NlpD